MLPLALSYGWFQAICTPYMKTKCSTHAVCVLAIIKLTEERFVQEKSTAGWMEDQSFRNL
jgi:hypothetical protein